MGAKASATPGYNSLFRNGRNFVAFAPLPCSDPISWKMSCFGEAAPLLVHRKRLNSVRRVILASGNSRTDYSAHFSDPPGSLVRVQGSIPSALPARRIQSLSAARRAPTALSAPQKHRHSHAGCTAKKRPRNTENLCLPHNRRHTRTAWPKTTAFIPVSPGFVFGSQLDFDSCIAASELQVHSGCSRRRFDGKIAPLRQSTIRPVGKEGHPWTRFCK